jgi:putative addiction module killer protein
MDASSLLIRPGFSLRGLESDWKPIAEGVRELRGATGPGYRIYYAWDGPALVILLCGGDKSSQVRDIARAVAY